MSDDNEKKAKDKLYQQKRRNALKEEGCEDMRKKFLEDDNERKKRKRNEENLLMKKLTRSRTQKLSKTEKQNLKRLCQEIYKLNETVKKSNASIAEKMIQLNALLSDESLPTTGASSIVGEESLPTTGASSIVGEEPLPTTDDLQILEALAGRRPLPRQDLLRSDYQERINNMDVETDTHPEFGQYASKNFGSFVEFKDQCAKDLILDKKKKVSEIIVQKQNHFGAFRIDEDGIERLRNHKCWITDEAINAWLSLLQNWDFYLSENIYGRKRSVIMPSCFMLNLLANGTSYCYESVKNHVKNIHDCPLNGIEGMYVPISDLPYGSMVGRNENESSHWSFIHANVERKSIMYIGSMTADDAESKVLYCVALLLFFRDYANENQIHFDMTEWKLFPSSNTYPKQEDGASCGVYILHSIRNLISGHRISILSKEQIKKLRKEFLKQLILNKVEYKLHNTNFIRDQGQLADHAKIKQEFADHFLTMSSSKIPQTTYMLNDPERLTDPADIKAHLHHHGIFQKMEVEEVHGLRLKNKHEEIKKRFKNMSNIFNCIQTTMQLRCEFIPRGSCEFGQITLFYEPQHDNSCFAHAINFLLQYSFVNFTYGKEILLFVLGCMTFPDISNHEGLILAEKATYDAKDFGSAWRSLNHYTTTNIFSTGLILESVFQISTLLNQTEKRNFIGLLKWKCGQGELYTFKSLTTLLSNNNAKACIIGTFKKNTANAVGHYTSYCRVEHEWCYYDALGKAEKCLKTENRNNLTGQHVMKIPNPLALLEDKLDQKFNGKDVFLFLFNFSTSSSQQTVINDARNFCSKVLIESGLADNRFDLFPPFPFSK